MHCHFGGRPMMSAMLYELLHYMKGFPDVWFGRHDEVARWVLAQDKVQLQRNLPKRPSPPAIKYRPA
jgi:hypothetical protein